MRYRSVFHVTFSAKSDTFARQIALQHLEKIQEELSIEGADHPYDIRLDRIIGTDGNVLDESSETAVERS